MRLSIPTWRAITWNLYRRHLFAWRDIKTRRLDRTNPIEIEHPYFGTHKYNRQLNEFSTPKQWCDSAIEVTFKAERSDDPMLEATIEAAIPVFQAKEAWHARLIDCAARDLLEQAQDWNAEDEEISEEEFKRRIVASSVTFYNPDDFEFWFEDGDLFWGHSIMLNCTHSGGPESATMHG